MKQKLPQNTFSRLLLSIVCVTSVFVTLMARTADVRADENRFSYAGYTKFGYFDVSDPDGDTDGTFSIVPGFKMNYDLAARGQRVFGTFEYTAFATDADYQTIGQEVSGFSLGGGWEKRFAVSRDVKVWLGVGGFVGNYSFDKRQDLASDGYLANSYEKRTETLVGASLTADTYFNVSERWRFGVGAYYDIAFGDGFQSVGLTGRFEFQ